MCYHYNLDQLISLQVIDGDCVLFRWAWAPETHSSSETTNWSRWETIPKSRREEFVFLL